MNPIAAFNVARASVRRDEASDRAASADRSENAHDISSKTASKQAEFSALLALLAGTGARVRSDILKQLPAEGASLIDRLLNGAGEATSEGEAGVALVDAGANATGGETADDASGTMSDASANQSAQSAADAMRYGQLKRNDSTLENPGRSARPDDAVGEVPAGSNDRSGTNGLLGIARALRNSPASDALARVASRRGASVEQLLALGDEKGADARAALDQILAQAGTPAGAELALLTGENGGMPGVAAAAIAAANLASANARSAGNVEKPVRDADALVPEFRSRVDRVIARMKQEYGHDVTLVETARSQERQDFLFEQGRTRPGSIVTWTRDSAHTRGEAADLLVDGQWNNAEGFARLQRIAREEGLRTLGVKDPGHVELPRNARAAEAMLDNASRIAARIERTNTTTGTAAASPVAAVAGVASVAGVARVVEAGAPPMPAGAAYASMQQATNAPAGSQGNNGNAFGKGERDENGKPMNEGRKLGHRDESSDARGANAYGLAAGPASSAQSNKSDAAPLVTSVSSADRVADLQDAKDATPGAVSRLTLSVDGENGGDRITIDLRGKSVGTTISTDAASADNMRARTGELQDALGRHGLEADTVRISGTSRAEGTDAPRGVSAERDALKLTGAQQGSANDSAANNGQRERSTTAREWDRQEERRARDEQQAAKEQAKQDARQDAQRDRQRMQQRYLNENK